MINKTVVVFIHVSSHYENEVNGSDYSACHPNSNFLTTICLTLSGPGGAESEPPKVFSS